MKNIHLRFALVGLQITLPGFIFLLPFCCSVRGGVHGVYVVRVVLALTKMQMAVIVRLLMCGVIKSPNVLLFLDVVVR